ncbi:MAG: universal stress protein [Vicinamibacterales bacterium]
MFLRSILCPVDFSEQSRQALRLSGLMAGRFQSRLVVLSVVDPLLAEAAKSRLKVDLVKKETRPALAAFVKESWSGIVPPPPQPVLEVRVGRASDAIRETAERDAADLIVMGTQGLGGVRKWLLGSTTEHVLRRTRTPVLAVPPAVPGAAVALQSGAILAATDFSDSSIEAAKFAAMFAEQFKLPMLLAHVVAPVSVPPQWSLLLEESDQGRLTDARKIMKALAKQVGGALKPDTVVLPGNPAETIAALAAERRAGLIVMGLTGDQGPFAQRPGSIAYRVLCASGVPVLIVPPASEANT